jgi:hypothetical protein
MESRMTMLHLAISLIAWCPHVFEPFSPEPRPEDVTERCSLGKVGDAELVTRLNARKVGALGGDNEYMQTRWIFRSADKRVLLRVDQPSSKRGETEFPQLDLRCSELGVHVVAEGAAELDLRFDPKASRFRVGEDVMAEIHRLDASHEASAYSRLLALDRTVRLVDPERGAVLSPVLKRARARFAPSRAPMKSPMKIRRRYRIGAPSDPIARVLVGGIRSFWRGGEYCVVEPRVAADRVYCYDPAQRKWSAPETMDGPAIENSVAPDFCEMAPVPKSSRPLSCYWASAHRWSRWADPGALAPGRDDTLQAWATNPRQLGHLSGADQELALLPGPLLVAVVGQHVEAIGPGSRRVVSAPELTELLRQGNGSLVLGRGEFVIDAAPENSDVPENSESVSYHRISDPSPGEFTLLEHPPKNEQWNPLRSAPLISPDQRWLAIASSMEEPTPGCDDCRREILSFWLMELVPRSP